MDKKGLFNFHVLDIQLQGAENYTAWALTMQYNLRAFGVWGYVQGTLKFPSAVDISIIIVTLPSDVSTSSSQSSIASALTQDQWVRADEQIMAYIMRSISIPIRLFISRSTSTREQWLALSRMFVQTNVAREYQLCQALQEAKQEDRSIWNFYLLLSGYWEKLQIMEVLFQDSISDFALKFQKQRDRWNLFHFAM